MINILVVGCGSIGRRHIENFIKHGVNDISCVDTNQERLDIVTEKFGISKTYKNHKDAFNKEKYSGVIICTPTSMHTNIAIDAARNESHIFLEKPVADTLKDIDILEKLQKEKNLQIFVAYCHRFIPSVKRLKEIIDKNTYGRVCSINMSWETFLPDWHVYEDYRSFYMAKKSMGGGALLDESHGIDLLQYIFDDICEVSADVKTISHLEIDSDDWAAILFKMKNGIYGKANFDLFRRDPKISMEILTEKTTIIWDRIDHQIKIFDPEKKNYLIEKFTKEDIMTMYDLETIHFINCLKGKEQSLIPLNEGIKTMNVINASFKSSEKNIKIFL